MIITRSWAMPNKETFLIKPIKELVEKYLNGVIIDPFANNCKYGSIRNDLNPIFDTDYHLDALEFLKGMNSSCADVVLFDPPYSISQAAECYNSFGKDKLPVSVSNMAYWSGCKNEISRILKPGGIVICCGWSSMGLGKNRGFEIIEILLVPHGGQRNDTIIMAERKL